MAYGNASSPFGPGVTGYLAQRTGDVTMAVYDDNTGITWDLHPGQVQVTASIVKVDVMAAALAADQGSGGIPPRQASLMAPMIEVSELGLQSTTPYTGVITATNLGWADTTTSADDMVRVLRIFAFHDALLSDPSRAHGLSLVHSVEPSQVWGVPAGAPAGSVAVKTGFITPAPGDAQVNSIGHVSGGGRNYVFAILTDGNPSEVFGEDTVNALSSLVFDALAPG